MIAPGKDASRSQIRGSSLLLAGQSFAVLVNLVSQVLIVRYLSQEAYGIFAYALSVAMIAEVVSGFGMRRGVARYMPMYHESEDLARTAGTLVLAVGTVLALGLSVVLLIAGLRGVIAGSFSGDTTAVIVLVVLSLTAPIGAMGTLLDGVLAVFAKPRAIVARRFVVTPLFRFIVVLVLVLGSQGVVLLAAGYVVAGLLGLLLYGPLLLPTLRDNEVLGLLRPGRFVAPVRQIFRFTVPLLTSDLSSVSLLASGGIVLGLLGSATEVAELRAVMPLALTMGYVLSTFGMLLVPISSRLYARSDSTQLNHVYWQTSAWTAVLVFPIFLTCVVLAEPLTVLLFGEVYSDAAPVLAVLAVGRFIQSAGGHNELLLSVYGRIRFIVIANLGAITVNLVLVILLAPPYAAVGAALATSAALLALNVVNQIGLARLTDVRGLSREVLPIYLTIAAATLVATAVQLSLTPPTAVGIAMVIAAVVVVFAVARERLALAETFPELARIPIVRRLVGAR